LQFITSAYHVRNPGCALPFKDLNARLKSLILDERLLLLIYVLAALIVTIQRGVYEFPNDFAIFRASFWNLLAHKDLYVLRLDQAHDYFKYSPSFALLFAPFAILPFLAGLFVWNLVNALSIFFALRLLLPREQWALAQILVALPALRSLQSSQSNALVAALIIVAFVSFERGWLWRGAVAIAVGAVIKIFPLAALSFALPRPDRLRAILFTALSTAVLIALPLLVISPHELVAQYQSWGALERNEAALVGSSLMEIIRGVGITWPAWPVQLIGATIVVAVLILRMRDWNDRQLRLQFLGFVMVFCVVFNHRAERQSAVIALCGMIIWYLAWLSPSSSPSPRSPWRTAFFAIVYFLVAVTATELVPDAIKHILVPQTRFSIPLTILWLVMLGELAFVRNDRPPIAEAG
jgi:glycosyl transferase family 87